MDVAFLSPQIQITSLNMWIEEAGPITVYSLRLPITSFDKGGGG